MTSDQFSQEGRGELPDVSDFKFHAVRIKQILLATEGVLVLALVGNLIAESTFLTNWTIAVSILVLGLAFLALKKNRTKLAVSIFLWTLTTAVNLIVFIGFGLKDVAVLAYPGILIFAGMISNRSLLFPIFFYILISVVCIGTADVAGWIDFENPAVGVHHVFDTTMILCIIGFSVWLIARDLSKSIWEIQEYSRENEKQLKALREAKASLQEASELLEKRVAERTKQLSDEVQQHKETSARLKRSEEHIRDIAEFALDWFWDTDAELIVIGLSEKFFAVTGLKPESVIGKSVKALGSDQAFSIDLKDKRALTKNLLAHQPINDVEISILARDGGTIYVQLTAKPLFDDGGQFLGYRGAGRDVTLRHRQEEQMKAAWEAAERAREEAEQANKAKSTFLSAMSHELRTPLNSILGFSQLLNNDNEHPLNPDQKKFLSYVLNSGEHLLALINEVLDLAKVESGVVDLSLEPVDLGPIIEDCLILSQSLGVAKKISIVNETKGQTLPLVQADRVRLKQIIINLMSNAVKYNVAEGRVTILAERTPDKVKVRIIDTGHGIDPDNLDKVFQPFTRLGHDQKKIEGTGIGMAIARNLVEAQGGEIGVISTPGEGSEFWFDLNAVKGSNP